MTDTQLKRMNVDLAVRLADAEDVATYADDGQIYTSADRTQAINDARRDVMLGLFQMLSFEDFVTKFPTLVKTVNDIALTANTTVEPFAADVRQVLGVKLRAATPSIASPGNVCYPVPVEVYQEIKSSESVNSSFRGDTSEPKFFFHDSGAVEVIINASDGSVTTIVTGVVDITYLVDLVDSDLTSNTPEPYMWYAAVYDKAFELLTGLRQE